MAHFILAPLKLRPYGAIQMSILLLLLLLVVTTGPDTVSANPGNKLLNQSDPVFWWIVLTLWSVVVQTWSLCSRLLVKPAGGSELFLATQTVDQPRDSDRRLWVCPVSRGMTWVFPVAVWRLLIG